MDERLSALIARAKTADAREASCAIHPVYADGMSQIRPGAIRSYVCVDCGSRFSERELSAEWLKFFEIDPRHSAVHQLNQLKKDPAMTGIIRPTVGRVVLFHLGDATPSLEWNASPDGSNTYAALITYVHNDHVVNLSAFDANGIQEGFTSVPLVQEGDMPAQGYWCEWMPYQKKVASGQIPPTLHAAPPEA